MYVAINKWHSLTSWHRETPWAVTFCLL